MTTATDLFPGFRSERVADPAPRSSPASADLAHRCCCCTAIRRPTPAGTRSPAGSPKGSPSSPPTCAAMARVLPRRRTSGHAAYSKRRMGEDAVALMRGARSSPASCRRPRPRRPCRLPAGARPPEAVGAVAVLDIVPTAYVWRGMDCAVSRKSYHWPFLAQAAPLPETLIAGATRLLCRLDARQLDQIARPRAFDPAALAAYRANFHDPARVHAMCEDYRAGATIDRDLDEADLAAGRRIAAPLLALWGSDYVGRGAGSPLERLASTGGTRRRRRHRRRPFSRRGEPGGNAASPAGVP